jgi:hypothetical protein
MPCWRGGSYTSSSLPRAYQRSSFPGFPPLGLAAILSCERIVCSWESISRWTSAVSKDEDDVRIRGASRKQTSVLGFSRTSEIPSRDNCLGGMEMLSQIRVLPGMKRWCLFNRTRATFKLLIKTSSHAWLTSTFRLSWSVILMVHLYETILTFALSPVPTAVRGGGAGTNYRTPGPEYVPCILVFLSSIRCNYVVICRADGTCAQRSSCFISLLLPLLIRPCCGARKTFFTWARTRSRRPWLGPSREPGIA